jgi:hypothetical protein
LTYNAFAAFAPIPILIIGVVLPKFQGGPHPVEKFGSGRFRTQIYIVLASTLLVTLGAAFRAVVSYFPRAAEDPAWYHGRACFYCFGYTIEIMVVYLYAAVRVDQRFYVPNGSSGPGDYSVGKGDVEPRIVGEDDYSDKSKYLESERDESEKIHLGNGAKDIETG